MLQLGSFLAVLYEPLVDLSVIYKLLDDLVDLCGELIIALCHCSTDLFNFCLCSVSIFYREALQCVAVSCNEVLCEYRVAYDS